MKKMKNNPLNGAWEVRGVIGTRIEIDAPHIVVLWRNSPVLTTTFKKKKLDDGIELVLKHRGMRYENANSDYAEMRELLYKDGKLEMTEYFPITGESRDTLEKTDKSRFGNFTIVDEVLCELKGKWRDEYDHFTLKFSGNTLTLGDEKIRVHVLRSDSGYPANLQIVNVDASVYEVFCFMSLEYTGSFIIGRIMVYDASPMEVVFRRV